MDQISVRRSSIIKYGKLFQQLEVSRLFIPDFCSWAMGSTIWVSLSQKTENLPFCTRLILGVPYFLKSSRTLKQTTAVVVLILLRLRSISKEEDNQEQIIDIYLYLDVLLDMTKYSGKGTIK